MASNSSFVMPFNVVISKSVEVSKLLATHLIVSVVNSQAVSGSTGAGAAAAWIVYGPTVRAANPVLLGLVKLNK